MVAAPSKIPRASGDRVKTDRRDAELLAQLLLAGKLHAVRVPGDEEEALRDLVRAREQVRVDLMRGRHRLSKLLLRHGIRFDDGNAWTDRHRRWLETVTLDWPAAQTTMLDARGAIDALCHRRGQLEREIVAMIPDSPWAAQIGRLRCLRGVETLSAVGLCAEIGDFERFARAEQLMSYVGLVPCESTTGQQRRLGSITKTGSGHARRLLIEAAWHYRNRPRIGTALRDRQDSQPPEAIAIAWSAEQRLHRTWTRLERVEHVGLGDHPAPQFLVVGQTMTSVVPSRPLAPLRPGAPGSPLGPRRPPATVALTVTLTLVVPLGAPWAVVGVFVLVVVALVVFGRCGHARSRTYKRPVADLQER